jgi:hypothetical protein
MENEILTQGNAAIQALNTAIVEAIKRQEAYEKIAALQSKISEWHISSSSNSNYISPLCLIHMIVCNGGQLCVIDNLNCFCFADFSSSFQKYFPHFSESSEPVPRADP